MKNKKMSSVLSAGLMAGVFAFATLAPLATVYAATPVTVTITKYIDGQVATALTSQGNAFSMNAAWSAANIGAGSGQYALSAAGYAPDNTPFMAKTVAMDDGANYSTDEVIDGTIVGASCTPGSATMPSYSLAGYTTGDTMAAAIAATPTLVAPNFTNITSDKFAIVWNTTCVVTPPANVSVTIAKYVNGSPSTAVTANNASFPMNATWNTTNIGAGSGQYTLSSTGFNNPTAYEASTGDFNSGADYSTSEAMDGVTTGALCSATSGIPAYTLAGYTTGDTMAAAIAATPTMTAPVFTNMLNNKFVIVWNTKCPVTTTTEGTVGGDVIGGLTPGALAVTSVVVVNSTATADGTFAHGWKYTFNITVPDTETHLSMKFANWANTVNGSTILTANNMRISSAQADNSGATVLLTAANVYSTPTLNMTSDLDAGTPGKQVQVTVEVAVPTNTINGAYTTSYGVQTLI